MGPYFLNNNEKKKISCGITRVTFKNNFNSSIKTSEI
jgi:hypothetical protein